MAKRTKKTTTRTTSSTPTSTTGWLATFSFVAVLLLALALVLSAVFGWIPSVAHVTAYIDRIAMLIAICVPVVLSYRVARRQSQTWFVIWVVATVLVVAFYILGWGNLLKWW